MATKQNIETIDAEQILTRATQFCHAGYRLVQICATRYDDNYELTYSFDLEHKMDALRVIISKDTEILSISSVYSYAFLYENELKDLFGIKIKLISIDYQGKLYRTGVKTPFDTPKGEQPCPKEV